MFNALVVNKGDDEKTSAAVEKVVLISYLKVMLPSQSNIQL